MGLGKGRALPHSQECRRAPMTIDAHVLLAGFHYVFISPIDRHTPTIGLVVRLAEDAPRAGISSTGMPAWVIPGQN